MSKGNMLLGTVAGKLGDMVMMRRNGEQVQRIYIARPKDAKTTAQGQQRSKLANIVRMYQCASDYFARAFANKTSKQSDYNAFVQRNIGRSPVVYLPKEIAQAGGGVVAPYIISDGGLQPIIVTGQGVQTRTNISVGADFEITETTTNAELTAAILANNAFIQEGDQLSYLSIEQFTQDGVPRLRARKYELTLSSSDATPVLDVMPEQAMSVSGGFIAHGEEVYSGAYAWILSRKTKDKLDVSRQNLIVTSQSLYSAYTGTSAATRAAVSYGNNQDVFLTPGGSTGNATQPSYLPSIANVRLDDVNLDGYESQVALTTAGQIAIGDIVLTGSNLGSVTTMSLTIKGDTASTDDVIETVAVGLTASGNTSASNTAVVELTNDIERVSQIAITIDGYQLFSWSYTATSGGGEGEGDLFG